MKFIRDLLARKSAPRVENVEVAEEAVVATVAPEASSAPASAENSAMPNLQAASASSEQTLASAVEQAAASQDDSATEDILSKINASVSGDNAAGSVNIWDMDAEEAVATPDPEPASQPRRRRNQTRVLGFNPAEAGVVSIFDKAQPTASAVRAKFPVGWVLVVDGPGRGECFSLEAGMSQIGRGDDQAVKLDFGDNTISRTNHAAIVYDAETHDFMLGQGGKKNIVRLNGKPVISNEPLSSHDEIKIGETILRFVALCNNDFNWEENPGDEENEDVAIA